MPGTIDFVENQDLELGFRDHLFTSSPAVTERWQPAAVVLGEDPSLMDRRDLTMARLDDVADYFQPRLPDIDAELILSRMVIERAYAEYAGGSVNRDGYNGSVSTFLVSARSKASGGYWEPGISSQDLEIVDSGYRADTEDIVPITSRLGESAAVRMIDALPPMILDHYIGTDVSATVVVVPGMSDIDPSLRLRDKFEISRRLIRDGVSYSRQIGSEIVGLSGVMPLLTGYGEHVQVDGITTTSGHPGTLNFVSGLVEGRLEAVETCESLGSIPTGVIGACGNIGANSASLIARRFGDRIGRELFLADVKTGPLEKMVSAGNDDPSNEVKFFSSTVKEIVERCAIVVVATDTPVDLSDAESIRGIVFDDSEPASVSTVEVEKRGGQLAQVLGVAPGDIRRHRILYGGQVCSPEHVYGCEAEALVLGMTGRLDLAVNGPVNGGNIEAFAEVAQDVGLKPAPLQNQGKLLMPHVAVKL